MAKEIKRDSLGIVFVEKKTRIFQTPDTLFYPYEEIQTVIDSLRICTYGEILDRHKFDDLLLRINLIYSDDTTYTPIYMDLEPDEKFSYCVRPGKYQVSSILIDNKGKIDQSIELPKIEFYAEKNKTNYIGSISLGSNIADSNNCIAFPFKCMYDDNKSAGIDFMFGLIGTIIYEGLKDRSLDADGFYLLKVLKDENFIYRSKNEKTIILMKEE